MANAVRGEVPLQVGEATYTIAFSTNAMCELEDLLDLNAMEIQRRLFDIKNPPRTKFLRALLWGGLQDHHAAEFATVKTVGELIDEIDDLGELGMKIARAWLKAIPTKEDATAPVGPRRRRRREAGTSPASSEPGAD